MTVTMYDSTDPSAIPSNAVLVASYVDGYGGYTAAVARFGAAKCVSISVDNNDADIADVESGAMTPAELPAWIAAQKARGIARPGVYCNESTWAAVKSAVGDADVSYWIADWTGSPFSIAGADAVQYASESSYDLSLVQTTFPWYPGGSTPVTPTVTFPIVEGATDGAGATSGPVHTLQTNLNKWAADIKLTTLLVVDGDFGTLTLAAVKLALTYFDWSAANVALGEVTEALWDSLEGAPPSTTWNYLAPTGLHVVSAGYTSVKLAWDQPALDGHPTPDHYVLWMYHDGDLVASYPRSIPGATLEYQGGSLAENTAYVAHVGTSGVGNAHLGADVFASVSFSTGAPPKA